MNMKIKNILLCLGVVFGTVSCSGFLDRSPVDLLLPDQIFKDEAGVEAYFATLYSKLPLEDFNWQGGKFNEFPGRAENNASSWAGETLGVKRGEMNNTWTYAYTAIRSINDMIMNLQKSTAISQKQIEVYIAEARCLRAISYMYLVKLWGGVPILDKPLDYNASEKDLLRPRNLEYEVWDFIIKDLEYAYANGSNEKIYGRTNKFVALAFLSRAALYAGSLAKYSLYMPEYCVGIPHSMADEYYTKAMNAAKELIDSKEASYDLYNKYSDRVENFNKLFIDPFGNPEIIFAKGYDYITTKRTHSYDYIIAPVQVANTVGSYFAPYLESVEAFEYIDGSPGGHIAGEASNSITKYSTIESMFAGKDPRLYASIILPNSVAKGTFITIQSGIIEKGIIKTINKYNAFYDTVTKEFVDKENENTVRATGASASLGVLAGKTSFHMRKYMDDSRDKTLCMDWTSETDYIVMRYAEVLLNYVEAAMETNTNLDQALIYLNKVKERAGVKLTTNEPEDFTIERYRAERRSEFFAEGHLHWDLRRWRAINDFFSYDAAKQTHMRSGLYIYYDYANKQYWAKKYTLRDYKYGTLKDYYQAIPSDEMAKNKLFVNNPEY